MWIETGSSRLPDGVEEKLDGLGLKREDRTDLVWFNLDTGASLVLACIGGWRAPGPSHYRLFHVAPDGAMFDVTFAILGESAIHFDTDVDRSESYTRVRAEAGATVTARLGAVRLWERK